MCIRDRIGAVLVENGEITDRFSTFVNPKVPIPFRIEQLTSINDSMVMDAPTIEELLPKFLEFSKDAVMVAHNADFDMGFIMKNCDRLGIAHDFTYVDTVGMARFLLPALNRFKLDTVAKAVGVSLENHHRAVDDAACTAEIFVKFVKMLEERDIRDVDMLNEQGAVSVNTIRKLPTYHVIIFARNETGRINLYKLVSQSHLKYYHRRPRVPKSVLEQYRDGLLVGSACEAGELYQAILRNAPDTEIALSLIHIFGAVGHMSSLVTGGTCFMAVGALTGVGLLAVGIKKLGKLERFQKYIDTLGNHTYCNFEQLSACLLYTSLFRL